MSDRINVVRKRLRELVEYEVEDKGIPSISYALVDREGTLASGHCVLSSAAHQVTDQTIFRVGSCSKMFTGIALMQLVEQGKLDLDADVSTYLPGFKPQNPFAGCEGRDPAKSAVTLRKLMSHTSGMVRESSIGHYLDDTPVSLADIVDGLKTSTLKEDPSACVFQYSNAGIDIVGRVIEYVSGVEFTRHVRENVLRRLGMERSDFCQTPEIVKHLAPANMWTFEEDSPAPVFDMGGGGAAGNLFSTIPEMALFIQAMLRGGYTERGEAVLSPAMLHSMWEPIGIRGKASYGLTFGVGALDGWKSAGHNGAVYGYATHLSFLPEAGLGIVICATLDVVNALISRIGAFGLRLGLAARAMGREPDKPVRYRPLANDELEQLPGFYNQDRGAEVVEVRSKGRKLYLMGDGVPLRIQPRTDRDYVVDGRLFGPGSEYPYLDVAFERIDGQPPRLEWKGKSWYRSSRPKPEQIPDDVASYVGEYGPGFSVTKIFYHGGGLKCTIEFFYTHTLEKVGPATYKMHGLLYDDEILEFDVRNESGVLGLRVGAMFLARRDKQERAA